MIANNSPPPASLKDGTPDLTLSAGDNRCALWWTNTPDVPGHVVGCIGMLEVPPRSSAAPILELATEALRAQGCTLAIGPMDQNTWRNYRLVTFDDGSPAFPREPSNSPTLPTDFTNSGFTSIAEYTSSSFQIREQSLTRIASRVASRGITIRQINTSDLATELRRLHHLSLAAFAENFLYTPLGEAEFLAMYLNGKSQLDPRFILIAEDKTSTPVGFVFTYPNPHDPDSLIVKTLAVHPDKRHLGLGSLLVNEVQNRALRAGIPTAIHALQHQNNSSLKITARHKAKTIRHYTLYQKSLQTSYPSPIN